jgi:uncharacterized protein
MTDEMGRVAAEFAARFRLSEAQVNTAVTLLTAGESVPFIMRYRKLETGGIKTAPLRLLSRQLISDTKRLAREERRQAHNATQATQKKERMPVNPSAGDSAGDSAGNLPGNLMGKIQDDLSILDHLRSKLWEDGVISSTLLTSKKNKKKSKNKPKWADFVFEKIAIQSIPARRLHYLLRGRREQALSIQLAFKEACYGETYLASQFKDEPKENIKKCWEKKCLPALEVDVLARLRARADDEMIYGIEKQLQGLLLAPKVSSGVTIGLYAERRMNLGVAVVDEAGVLLDGCTLFPMAPDFLWHEAITTLARYISKYGVTCVGLGNGPFLQTMKQLMAGFVARYPDITLTASAVAVDEVGMSRDISAFKGALSVARRLQNPLIELLQTPVEQMQFGDIQDEVNPKRLTTALIGVIEDTVNRIGVDVNTAPAQLLRYVSGLNLALAKAVVAFRETEGAFKTREDLKKVPGMEAMQFEQSAGFLRILNGENALDATRLHPTHYQDVDKLDALSKDARQQIESLRVPWRDPRTAFKPVQFDTRVKALDDLKIDMMLEGVVTRIASYGAFIDIGLPVLGLLHISALAKRFVRDPHELLRVGDVISVHVLQVDIQKQQIALGMKSEEKPAVSLEISKKKRENKTEKAHRAIKKERTTAMPFNTAMADALTKLKRGSS